MAVGEWLSCADACFPDLGVFNLLVFKGVLTACSGKRILYSL